MASPYIYDKSTSSRPSPHKSEALLFRVYIIMHFHIDTFSAYNIALQHFNLMHSLKRAQRAMLVYEVACLRACLPGCFLACLLACLQKDR